MQAITITKKVKCLPEPFGPYRGTDLRFYGHGHGASVTHGVPVYSPACVSTKLYCLVTDGNVHEQLAQDHTQQSSG